MKTKRTNIMKHTEILTAAAANLGERENQYGPEEVAFTNAARIASILLNKTIVAHDIATILLALDLGRIPNSRTNDKNYVNLINNAAYVGQYSRTTDTALSQFNDDVAEMASKLAPMPRAEYANPAE